MAKSTKLKAQAKTFVCQNKEQTAECIKQIGDCQRMLTRIETELNDIIATETDKRKSTIDQLKQQIETLSTGVQIWCEANREVLCVNGGKTANLITGEVNWRQRPPKVSVRGKDKVIETLRALKLHKFIRTKEDINKDAILAEPKAVATISGINVVTGIEDFVISPFEIEVTP